MRDWDKKKKGKKWHNEYMKKWRANLKEKNKGKDKEKEIFLENHKKRMES